MRKIKIGVAGCGSISQIMHLPNLWELRKEFELVALCDASRQTLNAMGLRYGVHELFEDFDEFLKADFVAVVLAVGVALHSEMAMKAAAAGKHVLVEKDMCLGLGEAADMIAARDRYGVVMMVGHDRRFDPGFLLGVEAIQKVGTVKMVHLHWHSGGNFTQHLGLELFRDVPEEKVTYAQKKRKELEKLALGQDASTSEISALGTLTGVGTHHLALIQGALGAPVEITHADFPDSWGWWMVHMRLSGGIPCSYTGVHLPKVGEYSESLIVQGETGIVKIQFPAPYLRNAPTRVSVTQGNGEVTHGPSSFEEAFKVELRHFYDCIVHGKKPLTNLEVGRENLNIIHSIIQCLRERKPARVGTVS